MFASKPSPLAKPKRFFNNQYPPTVCIHPQKITLPNSNLQATFKRENSHTLTVCIHNKNNDKTI